PRSQTPRTRPTATPEAAVRRASPRPPRSGYTRALGPSASALRRVATRLELSLDSEIKLASVVPLAIANARITSSLPRQPARKDTMHAPESGSRHTSSGTPEESEERCLR